ncbi:MAG: alkaline phosphatase family protein [Anaerolineae bacterium]|nr:alkaline phosphatase family protein [Anaerolineae bacterium]
MSSVVFVMIDGLRPDALDKANLPGLQRLKVEGAYTLRAQSVNPSITLPCHTSIFHSVPPSRHGIVSNEWTPQVRPIPGLIERLNQADKRCAFFTNWEELRDLSRPGNLAFSWYANESYNLAEGDRMVTDAALPYLQQGAFDFTFVYLGTVDSAGHAYGWMSDEYLQQAEAVDAELRKILDALRPDASIIVHADHGGHERTHGTEMPEDMTIPYFLKGAIIPAGHEIQAEVSLLDTAPTAAALLGVGAWKEWEGKNLLGVL